MYDFFALLESFSESLVNACYSEDVTPQIIMNYTRKSVNEVLDKDETNTWTSNANLCNSIVQYIEGHSPLVALLLQEVLKKSYLRESATESDEEAHEAIEMIGTTCTTERSSFLQYPSLDNLCQRPEILTLSQIFNHNILICSLHSIAPQELLWETLNCLASEKKWRDILEVLRALPQLQLQNDPMLLVLLDLTLLELIIESRGTKNLHFKAINCKPN